MNQPKLGTVLKKTLKCKCPKCGKANIFLKYLKPIKNCPFCQLDFSPMRSDDIPTWATIMIVGHILLPIIYIVDINWHIPMWGHMTLWPFLVLILTLLLLPPIKASTIGILWLINHE